MTRSLFDRSTRRSLIVLVAAALIFGALGPHVSGPQGPASQVARPVAHAQTVTESQAFIPLLIKDKCLRSDPLLRLHDSAEFLYADVAMVLHTSPRLLRPAPSDRTGMQAIAWLTDLLLDQMDFTINNYGQHDQLALAWYHGFHGVEQTLTADRALLEAAGSRLASRIGEGSRLDLAMEAGASALPVALRRKGSGHREDGTPVPDNQTVMLLITDAGPAGVPFGPGTSAPDCADPQCAVLAAAERSKFQGIRIIVIAVGFDSNSAEHARQLKLLRAVASDPGDLIPIASFDDMLDGFEAFYTLVYAPPIPPCPN